MSQTPEEAAAKHQEELDADLETVLSSPAGQRFYVRLLVQSGLWAPSFVAESSASSAYNEGRRSIGIALMSEAQRVCLPKYLAALKAHLTEESIRPAPVVEE